nr:MAG TPA: hypothetical protein [Caudoviricetes sp.]DAW12564.1 MAG TPA: hypothetical protein [Caudoviricetes sp.]DAY66102.1 MAG TPA: hypothetical protein [Caudoviricetes sp.]
MSGSIPTRPSPTVSGSSASCAARRTRRGAAMTGTRSTATTG